VSFFLALISGDFFYLTTPATKIQSEIKDDTHSHSLKFIFLLLSVMQGWDSKGSMWAGR